MFGWLRKLTGLGEPQVDSADNAAAPGVEPASSSQAPITMPAEWAQAPTAEQAPARPAVTQQRPAATPAAPTPKVEVVVTEPADYVVPEPPTVAVPEHREAAKPAAVEAKSTAEAKPAPASAPVADAKPAAAEAEAVEQADSAKQAKQTKQTKADAPVPAAAQAPASRAEAKAAAKAQSFDVAEIDVTEDEDLEETPVEAPAYAGLIPTPSARPAMPLSAHPNFAGLGLAPAPQQPPRMLQPEAALTPEAQRELLRLFDDLFGPRGRYRLEWRTSRNPGDDAVFAEIMTADLVRRVQNTIADVAELERPEPLRAIERKRDAGDDELKRAS